MTRKLLLSCAFVVLGACATQGDNVETMDSEIYFAPYDSWTEPEGFDVRVHSDADSGCGFIGSTSHFDIAPGETIDFELDFGDCEISHVSALGYLTKQTSSLQRSFARAKFDFGLEELAGEGSVFTDGAILSLQTSTPKGIRISVSSAERKAKQIRVTFRAE